MNRKLLVRATAIGTVAQLVMIGVGHFVPFVRDHMFAMGGMALSLVAGLLYASWAREGWGASLAGGAIAGGVCAIIGIAVSVALGDTLAVVLGFGTVGSVVAGLIGGGIAKVISKGEG